MTKLLFCLQVAVKHRASLFLMAVVCVFLNRQQVPDSDLTLLSAAASSLGVVVAPPSNVTVEFVFFMGLEGTGHHLVRELMEESPMVQRLETLGVHPKLTSSLSSALFDIRGNKGLWNSWCNKLGFVDLSHSVARVAHLMTQVRDLAESDNNNNNHQRLVVPLNILYKDQAKIHGMISYPNFQTCRPLTNPNIDLLQQACAQVDNVQCTHVYLSRPPVSQLESTAVKKLYNGKNLLGAMHMYYAHLNILRGQLLDYPHLTRGCWNFFPQEPSLNDLVRNETHNPTTIHILQNEALWEPMHTLFGWNDRAVFQEHLTSFYKPPAPLTEEGRRAILPKRLRPQLESLQQLHDRTLEQCQHNLLTAARGLP